MSLRWLATLRRTYALGSSCSARSKGQEGDGSATSACSRKPQGSLGREPSLTSRRTWALGSSTQRCRTANTAWGWRWMKGRMANSAENRCVSACRQARARGTSSMPRRATNSASDQTTQPRRPSASPASPVASPTGSPWASSAIGSARLAWMWSAARAKSSGRVASSASASCIARALNSSRSSPWAACRSKALRSNPGQTRCRCRPALSTVRALIRFLKASAMGHPQSSGGSSRARKS